MLLEIENLTANVKDKKILKGVNLQVDEGEHHVIIGPNGSGKTTLGRVIMGFEGYSVKGKIYFKGEDITELSPHLRAKKGLFITFQHPIELEGMKSANLIYEALKIRGKKFSADEFKKKYLEALHQVGLSDDFYFRDLNVGSSGGERKKLELVHLQMLEPDLAILDEVDSGLDVESVKRLARFINEWRGALIIITHNPVILKHLKNVKIHLFEDGKIVRENVPLEEVPHFDN